MLATAKQDAGLTALVPAERIYTQVVASPAPAWPFVRYGAPTGVPIRQACVDGLEVSVAMHTFAKAREQSGAIVETAEDFAQRIGAAVVRALDGKRPALPGGGYARILFANSLLLMDGAEEDAFHHVANFRVRAITS
jgi:hypothetical protein